MTHGTFPRYMMATLAFSGGTPMLNISRDEPDLCVVQEFDEDRRCFVGSWCTGFGFYGVLFPSYTTHELTDANREHYGTRFLVGPQGQCWPALAPFEDTNDES